MSVCSWKNSHYASHVAATQVVSTHGRINAKIKVTFLLYVFIRKIACKHHRALYSVKADIQHIMNIAKTALFLIVYRFSGLLLYPRKNNSLPGSRDGGGGGGAGGILIEPNLKLFSIIDGFPRYRMNKNQSIV